jgi:hypothetical protein
VSTNRPARKQIRPLLRKAIWLYLLIPIAVAWFSVSEYRAQFGPEPSSKQEIWGQFGDFLGGVVNPVVGLITIVLLIMTLRSQQIELREQRDQIAKQGFEQTFNTWLNSYRSAVHQVYFERIGKDNTTGFSGVRALHELLVVSEQERAHYSKERSEYKISLDPSAFLNGEKTGSKDRIRISLAAAFKKNVAYFLRNRPLTKHGWKWWRQTYDSNELYIGMLLRTLYTLIRWIDDHDAITWQQKWDYVSIVRARLSTPELIILFFNHHEVRGKNFTAYVERYALLDNLPERSHFFVDIARQAGTHRFTDASFQSTIARKRLLETGPIRSIAEQRRRDEAGQPSSPVQDGSSPTSVAK